MYRYERDDLLRIFSTMNCVYRPTLLCDPKALPAEPQWLTSHSHRHTRRRGNLRPPLPCAFLSNVRSLKNKADELIFLIQSNRDFKDCSVFCFTETWIDPSVPDTADKHLATHSSERIDHSICRTNGGVGGLAFSSTRDGAATLMFSPPSVLQNLKHCQMQTFLLATRVFLLFLLVSTYLPRPTPEQQSTSSLPASPRLKTLTKIA